MCTAIGRAEEEGGGGASARTGVSAEERMKFLAFNVRDDEREHFEETAARLGAGIVMRTDRPTLENADAVSGFDGLSIITQPVSAELLKAWADRGIRAVSTRTVGFDHIDMAAATRLGIAVSNVSYTPHTVAEYTVMAMIMCLRNMKLIMRRFDAGDFGLRGVRGRELGRCTVGVIGTGRIGAWVVHLLKPFGCRILASDVRENPDVKGLAEYVSREEIFRSCDIITFHTPAVPETFHIVNKDTLAAMKPGVILVNMSRGTVVDTEALIGALESGRVGAAALDVLENETSIYYRDFKGMPVPHRAMNTLASMPNVLLTPHTAFFTREAVSDMVEYSLQSLALEAQGKDDPRRVN